jgi:UDP-N-acetylmuramate dehydrogenase
MRWRRWSRRKESCLPSASDSGDAVPAEARRAKAEPREHVPLAPYSTLGVGGAARWYVRADTAEDVTLAHRWSRDRGIALFVLGGGSNLVIADNGLDALVMHMGIRGLSFETDGRDTRVAAGAGEPWDRLVRAAVERGLAGVECLSGIPGTVGGTPIQNVGAYGQEVGETIEAVAAFDLVTAQMRMLTASECGFEYRTSRFKRDDRDRFVICGVTFRLREGSPTATYADIVRYLEGARLGSPSVADVRQAVLDVRRRKGMVIDPTDLDTRSVGSFFMNPIVAAADRERMASAAGAEPPGFVMADQRVKIPAAWLIEHVGFRRGESDGRVGISSKHTLALINLGGATARDVLRLATRIKRAVVDEFGVWLRPEPVFVGFEDDPDVQYLQS